MRIRHRWSFLDASRYDDPVEYGMAAFAIIAVLLTILGAVMLCIHWFSGWTLSFFVPDVLVALLIAGNSTYEAKGLTGKGLSAYQMYREISRKSRREIRLDPQSIRRMDEADVRTLHDELYAVYQDEKANREAHRKVEFGQEGVLARIEERRRRLELDTRAHLDKTLYEGWTSEKRDEKT